MLRSRKRIRREASRRDMVGIFNLLVDAMSLERHLATAYSRRQTAETLRQWRLCGRTLSHLGKDYAAAVARYRQSVKARFGVGIRERS